MKGEMKKEKQCVYSSALRMTNINRTANQALSEDMPARITSSTSNKLVAITVLSNQTKPKNTETRMSVGEGNIATTTQVFPTRPKANSQPNSKKVQTTHPHTHTRTHHD